MYLFSALRTDGIMNPSVIDLCCLILFMCFAITAITSIILIVMRKHNKKNMMYRMLYIKCMKHVSLTVNSRTFYISKNTFKGETYAVFDRSKRKIC